MRIKQKQTIQWIRRLFAVCILGFLTFAAVTYQMGYYDFTFIERPVSKTEPAASADTADTEAVTETAETDTADTEYNETDTEPTAETEPSEKNEKTDTSNTGTTVKKATAKSVTASLQTEAAAKKAGYTALETGIYKTGICTLAKISISALDTLKKESYSNYWKRTTNTTEYERGCVYTEAVTTWAERPAVLLRNGYIIVDKEGDGLSVYRSDGKLFLSDYNEASFVLSDYRDENGNPLFYAISYETETVHLPIMQKNEFTGMPEESGEYEEEETEIEREVHTYYRLGENNTWELYEYSEETLAAQNDKGINCDGALDFGESDCDLVRYYNDYRWGYMSKSTGKSVIYPRFTKAYNPHDGIAVAFDGYMMYYIDEAGNIVSQTRYAEAETFVTYDEITMPDTDGIENLGMFYFDHGLIRLRIRENLITYKKYNYIKSADYTALFDAEGNRFTTPTGYSLVSYSDGILLLKKDGEEIYGYMNYKGEWIAQPVYTHAEPFISGLGVVTQKNGKSGLIDTNGKFILEPVFDAVSNVSNGMIAVYDTTTGWAVYRLMTK